MEISHGEHPWGEKIQNRAQAMVVTMPTDSWRNSLRVCVRDRVKIFAERNPQARPGMGVREPIFC
jgi:hypothetical protein